MRFDAFWPPDLVEHGLIERDLGAAGTLRFPSLDAHAVEQLCAALRSQTAELRARPVADITRAIARAADRLIEPGSELLAIAARLIPATTGYSAEMTVHVLHHMAQDWSLPALDRLVRAELGSARPLDGFANHGQRRTRALGPELTGHVFSGNVPGVAVTSLVRSLIVKSPSFGKTAADEPVLPVLFARALAQVDEPLARALVITHWLGGTRDLDAALADQADTLVVYGGDQAVAAARAHARASTRLVLHGPKLSFGIVGPEGRNNETARNAARAVATFDQQGCVSPHVIYVMGPPEHAASFARLVYQELLQLATELPRGRLRTEDAVAQHNARASAEFRQIAGTDIEMLTDPAASLTVVYDADPSFQPSCLNRFVYVKPLSTLEQLRNLLGHAGPHLQSVAIDGFNANQSDELAYVLATLGASRITRFDRLPWPPMEGHHDGSGPLRELLRFVDLET
jgi:hypothetical protein